MPLPAVDRVRVSRVGTSPKSHHRTRTANITVVCCGQRYVPSLTVLQAIQLLPLYTVFHLDTVAPGVTPALSRSLYGLTDLCLSLYAALPLGFPVGINRVMIGCAPLCLLGLLSRYFCERCDTYTYRLLKAVSEVSPRGAANRTTYGRTKKAFWP